MKRNLTKVLSIALLAATLLAATLLAGCATAGGAAAPSPAGDAFTIATSFYPMYIMALNVAGDVPGVRVVNMTQPTTGCLHDYSVTTEDMKNLDGADVLVINGAGMESFLDKVIAQFPGLKIIESSKGIPLIAGEGDEGDNPHVWVNIGNAATQVRTIGEQLAALDPAHGERFRANAEAYARKLEALKDRMHRELDGFVNRNIVTFHEAFPYFAQEFNLHIVGVIEREPGSEPSAKELSDTIEQIRELGVKALFSEPQYPATAAEAISKETGASVFKLDPAVTGDMDADAYLNIMEKNLAVLKQALQ